MMFLLSGDVLPYGFHLQKTNGKNSIAALPREIMQIGAFGFQPERGTAFDLLHQVRRRAGAGQRRENVNMIFHPGNDKWLAVVLRQDAANILMQFSPENLVAQIRPAVFGRENGVHQNLGERLGHDAMMLQADGGYNPFRVGKHMLADAPG